MTERAKLAREILLALESVERECREGFKREDEIGAIATAALTSARALCALLESEAGQEGSELTRFTRGEPGEWEATIRLCAAWTKGDAERTARLAAWILSLPGAPRLVPPPPAQPSPSSESKP